MDLRFCPVLIWILTLVNYCCFRSPTGELWEGLTSDPFLKNTFHKCSRASEPHRLYKTCFLSDPDPLQVQRSTGDKAEVLRETTCTVHPPTPRKTLLQNVAAPSHLWAAASPQTRNDLGMLRHKKGNSAGADRDKWARILMVSLGLWAALCSW